MRIILLRNVCKIFFTYLPLHPYRTSSTSVASWFLRLFRTNITADLPVQEPERRRHNITDVRQAQQHQRDSQDGVENGNYLAPGCFWSNVPITWNIKCNV